MVSLGDPNTRAGYTFRGWFDNANFEGTVVETITVGSTGPKIFYAMWEENTYNVVLNANDGTGREDSYANLTYSGDWTAETPARTGYTFLGWAYTPDGEVVCGENAKLSNFIAVDHENEATVTLYARWEAIKYTITYNLGMHAASTNHNNPGYYTMESGADIVLEALTPKSGFRFGGWYKNPEFTGEKVSTIACTDTSNYELYAKWEHGGEFSIAYTGKEGNNSVYTITRSIPDGAVPSTETQTVYVRTLNGTAYGSPVSVQDKYHFIHLGSDGIRVFDQNCGNGSSQTVKVIEDDGNFTYNGYCATGWQIGNAKRKYQVEIYKITNGNQNGNGLLGTVGTGKYTRELSQFSNKVTDALFKKTVTLLNSMSISNGNHHAVSFFSNDQFTKVQRDYVKSLSGKYTVKFTFSTTKKTQANITHHYDANNVKTAELQFNSGSRSFSYDILPGGAVSSAFINISGSTMTLSNVKAEATFTDNSKPSAKHIAPIALTEYAKGEELYLTVVYNEPISSISGNKTLSMSTKLSEYFESPTYVDNGTGTNAIVFKVKVKKDLTADNAQKINEYLTLSSGNFTNNIGTVSITVKDYKGN